MRDNPPSPRHRHIGCRFPYPSMCGQSDHRGKGMAHTIAESLHCPRTDLLYFGEVLDLVRFNHCLQIFKYHGQKDFVDQCQLFTCLLAYRLKSIIYFLSCDSLFNAYKIMTIYALLLFNFFFMRQYCLYVFIVHDAVLINILLTAAEPSIVAY